MRCSVISVSPTSIPEQLWLLFFILHICLFRKKIHKHYTTPRGYSTEGNTLPSWRLYLKVERNSGRANKLNNLGNFRRIINALEIIEKAEGIRVTWKGTVLDGRTQVGPSEEATLELRPKG